MKLTIRWRITLLCSLLLALCCIVLTYTLNVSATRMADEIEAAHVSPAMLAAGTENPASDEHVTIPMSPLHTARGTQEARLSFTSSSVVYTIAITAVGGALAYYVTGHALKRLEKLNEAVKQRDASSLDTLIVIPGFQDEIDELTLSFNDMSRRLYEAFSEQQRFSANAAHELRTPLAVLQTKLDVFRKNPNHTIEEYEALLSVFEKQLARLQNLVKTLLDMTHLDDLEDLENICVLDLIEEAADDLRPLAGQKKVEIEFDPDPSAIQSEFKVDGDADLLYRAFYNLVENAIKYNVEGGKVVIHAKLDTAESTSSSSVIKNETSQANRTSLARDARLRIDICDTGIGIPEDMQEKIFQPFFCVDKSRSRSYGGAGLGLALTHQIISRHDAKIACSSNRPCGTCFTIEFCGTVSG